VGEIYIVMAEADGIFWPVVFFPDFWSAIGYALKANTRAQELAIEYSFDFRAIPEGTNELDGNMKSERELVCYTVHECERGKVE